MTPARHAGKSRLTRICKAFQPVLAVLQAVAVVALTVSAPARAATTERIVVDWHTGLAINGFDPVAYFTDAGPMLGSAEFELRLGGATWRFRNPGNRAAFARNPEVYLPRFGGYDPIDVARGVARPGHPQVWLVVGTRLYLFQSEAARNAFVAAERTLAAAADARWPEVERALVP